MIFYNSNEINLSIILYLFPNNISASQSDAVLISSCQTRPLVWRKRTSLKVSLYILALCRDCKRKERKTEIDKRASLDCLHYFAESQIKPCTLKQPMMIQPFSIHSVKWVITERFFLRLIFGEKKETNKHPHTPHQNIQTNKNNQNKCKITITNKNKQKQFIWSILCYSVTNR